MDFKCFENYEALPKLWVLINKQSDFQQPGSYIYAKCSKTGISLYLLFTWKFGEKKLVSHWSHEKENYTKNINSSYEQLGGYPLYFILWNSCNLSANQSLKNLYIK